MIGYSVGIWPWVGLAALIVWLIQDFVRTNGKASSSRDSQRPHTLVRRDGEALRVVGAEPKPASTFFAGGTSQIRGAPTRHPRRPEPRDLCSRCGGIPVGFVATAPDIDWWLCEYGHWFTPRETQRQAQ